MIVQFSLSFLRLGSHFCNQKDILPRSIINLLSGVLKINVWSCDFYDNLIIIIDIIVTYSAPKFRLHMTRLMIVLILASMVNWMLDIGGWHVGYCICLSILNVSISFWFAEHSVHWSQYMFLNTTVTWQYSIFLLVVGDYVNTILIHMNTCGDSNFKSCI